MKNKSYRQSHPEKAAKPGPVSALTSPSCPDFQKAPFSRLFRVSELPEQYPETGFNIEITASPEECEALAQDFEIPAIDRLDAVFQIFKLNGGRFRVTGLVDADLREICVVSLEIFRSAIKANIDLEFIEIPKSAADRGRLTVIGSDPSPVLRLDGEQDPPETIIGGKIDLGAIASEFLALNLNPYPKKPGVKFEASVQFPEETGKLSPFEVLRKLKDDK